MELLKKLKFTNNLIPVIIQEYKTNKVLMLAYMNEEALKLTLKSGFVHFYSRSRKKIWKKGEVSGHTQKVKEIMIDCDSDTLLIKVIQKKAACHEGYKTCFFRKATNGRLKIVEKKVFSPEKVY